MATLNQVRVTYTGLPGGDAVSTFYFQAMVDTDLSQLEAFFLAVRGFFPSSCSIHVPDEGQVIDVTTGQPVGSWSFPEAGGDMNGNSGAPFAAVSGAIVHWTTGVFLGGRKIQGSTYLVPLTSDSFDTNGTIAPTVLDAIRSAASALAADPSTLSVYSRKNQAAVLVSGASVPDKAVVLRSRRD